MSGLCSLQAFFIIGCLPVVGVGHHAHLALHGSNLLLRGRLRASHSEEVHIGGIGSVVVGVIGIEEIGWWCVEAAL